MHFFARKRVSWHTHHSWVSVDRKTDPENKWKCESPISRAATTNAFVAKLGTAAAFGIFFITFAKLHVDRWTGVNALWGQNYNMFSWKPRRPCNSVLEYIVQHVIKMYQKRDRSIAKSVFGLLFLLANFLSSPAGVERYKKVNVLYIRRATTATSCYSSFKAFQCTLEFIGRDLVGRWLPRMQ